MWGNVMAKSHDVFVDLCTYANEADAEHDLQAVKTLHREGAIGTYDAAVVDRHNGDVHVHKVETPTRRGAWTGVGVGAVLGILFPPSIVGTAFVGGVAGGLVGHFAHGMSRKDVQELGETLDTGEAALIVIGRDRLAEKLEAALTRAERLVEKEVDLEGRELDKQLAAANAEQA
jgi:uncharacterized membrane protein